MEISINYHFELQTTNNEWDHKIPNNPHIVSGADQIYILGWYENFDFSFTYSEWLILCIGDILTNKNICKNFTEYCI